MKYSLTLLLFSAVFFAYSQEHAELSTYQARYPDQVAAKLKDIQDIVISYNKEGKLVVTNKNTVEKIYLDKYATQFSSSSISSSYFNKITSIKASSFEAVNEKKYKEHKVKQFQEKRVLSSSIFFDDDQTMSFAYEGLREGSKTRLTYETTSTNPELMTGCFFGDFLPTEHIEFTFTHPTSVKVSFKSFNGIDTLATYTKSQKKDLITHRWVLKNAKPFKREGGSPSFLYSIPHIYPIINSYQKDGKEVKVLGDVELLHNYYTSLMQMMEEDEDCKDLQVVVDSITKGKNTELDKVEAIFNYAQKDIKYVAYEDGLGGFVPRTPMTVFGRRYGDCKDMSTLQVKMMELAGINGYVAWVGTRRKPYTYDQLPTPACDNHMIATYKSQDGKWYILDATGTYSPFGYPSGFVQGKELLIHLSDTTFEVYKVETVPADQNVIQETVKISLDGTKLKGTSKVMISGYQLTDTKYATVDKDSSTRSNHLKGKFEKGNNKFFFTLDSYDFEKSTVGYIDYSFTVEDYVKQNGDEFYLNMNLLKLLSTEKMEAERENTLELDFQRSYVMTYELDLQGKYIVDYIPESKTFDYEKFSYTITYSHKGDKVSYGLIVNIKTLNITPEDFDEWNAMIKSLNKKYKEVIVLKSK
ncbi:transglutaminase-like domain-containing protein [Cyclobacteriaceae bacterium]|nr:transglutaminase-like domain-containing protein [Cyclobacteriaceae bacterium]